MKEKSKINYSLRNGQLREKLLDLLPSHGWSIMHAGIAAGYSKVYAQCNLAKQIKKDGIYCQRIIDKRREMQATSGDKIEVIQRKLDEIINNDRTTAANRIRCLDIKCKILGVYSEKRVIEDVTRQRELDGQERIEAMLLAKLRLRALPAPGGCVALPAVYPQFTEQRDTVTLGDDCVSRTAPSIDALACKEPVKQGESSTSGSDNSSETGTTPSAPGEGIPPNDGSAHRSPVVVGKNIGFGN